MKIESIAKYKPFPTVDLPNRQWPDKHITRAPVWCSVDLRDGNQALAIPMNVSEKLEMFDLLVKLGFKQIEVGFPSASDTEFNFLRRLVDEQRIPDDVQVQVLVQAREHLIRRTFESLHGVKRAIVHLYNSTSPLQRRVTFRNASKASIKDIAVKGTQLVKSLVPSVPNTDVSLQYSPESFSDTELDFSLEVCEAVMDVWQPTEAQKIILNLPATVEWTTPNVHADQIEWFCTHMQERNKAYISLHTHNDRGTGVAATELGLMAGADRVEGTLFGNGERTGNLDIVTVALNMNSHGIATGLNFSDLTRVRNIYERCTRMKVPERLPYAGDLVFTAFSGSHQDAIKKGMDLRNTSTEDADTWGVPYLTIDPQDIGRNYKAIIRINSQSGKGGVAYILDREYGLDLPKSMHPQVGEFINQTADKEGKELSTEEIYAAFCKEFVNVSSPLELKEYKLNFDAKDKNVIICEANVIYQGRALTICGSGNGPISSFVAAIDQQGWKQFKLDDYRSHAIGQGSATDSAAYIEIKRIADERIFWGTGIHPSIEMAGLLALVSAFNRSID